MGKPKHSNDPRGEQKGAQQHDEGQYGPKAFQAKWNEITDHSDSRREAERGGSAEQHERELNDPSVRDGRHRLFEERKQHDEADRAQDKNRLMADVEVHNHDRSKIQLPHGRNRSDRGPKLRGPGESGK